MSFDTKLVDTLLSGARSDERAAAAEALARLGPEARGAAVALVRASGDREAGVRDWAVAALEDLGPPPAADIQPLADLTANPDLNIAYWACTLLGRLKGEAAPAIKALIDVLAMHAHISVRERAAWALGQVGPPAHEALPALEQAAKSSEERLSRLARKAIAAIRQ